MGWKRILAALGAMMAMVWAIPLAAAPAAPPAMCSAVRDANGGWSQWHCGARDWDRVPAEARVRLAAPPGEAPRFVTTRLSQFRGGELTVEGRDGSVIRRQIAQDDFEVAHGQWLMRLPVPQMAGGIAAVELRYDQPRHTGLVDETRLVTASGAEPTSEVFDLAVAALCGLLAAPLLFNFAFWRVLRQRFLVWHTLMVVFMLVQTAVTSGLITHFARLPVSTVFHLGIFSLTGAAAMGSLFAVSMIEPGKIDPLHRRLLEWSVLWGLAISVFYVTATGPAAAYAPHVYYGGYIPVFLVYFWAVIMAWRRGSRAVMFLALAWLPVIGVNGLRIASLLGAGDAPLDLYFAHHLAAIAEILITGMGAVDRFMILRRERDNAMFTTQRLEQAADRDPLTGLSNRRALTANFAADYAGGFRTLALCDLDHFKDINDRFGHAVGDRVIVAAANALAPDEDTRVVRMGGEEFLLMLRGPDAAQRAEMRRQAIAQRVAAEIGGLDRVVTASMGLVEQAGPGTGIAADFSTLYDYCDRLLYDAKRAGRNRMMREKLQHFADRQQADRRQSAKPQAA
ncbi:MAG: diguanylate cyclase [Citromicrobium sp.]|nr:MAG: diguanylate cyclase [Citromicrobium sp.]